VGSAWLALAGIVVVLLGLLAYYASLVGETGRLEQQADLGQRDLARAKATVKAMGKDADANKTAADLKAEVDALRLKTEAVRQAVDLIGKGSLGNPNGYAQYLTALAGVSEEGLWITSVAVTNAGRLVTLSGRALRTESILRYAKRLNEAFAPYEVQFNSMELTPDTPARTGEPGKPPLTTVAFRLF
jgi:hypothetical protein